MWYEENQKHEEKGCLARSDDGVSDFYSVLCLSLAAVPGQQPELEL